MKLKTIAFLLAGLVLYAGLTSVTLMFYKDDPDQMNWQDREAFNTKYIYKLDLTKAISRNQVIDYLGGPDITEAKKHQQQVYQVMYYRTHRTKTDGITTKDECTAILFKNQQLIAIGETAVAQFNQLD
jgi:N-acetylneuraminic acid mutarotase